MSKIPSQTEIEKLENQLAALLAKNDDDSISLTINRLARDLVALKNPRIEFVELQTSDLVLAKKRMERAVCRGDQLYLPKLVDGYSAIPSIFLRSSLFTSSQHEKVVSKKLGSNSSQSIIFSGPKLGDYDRKVLLACLASIAEQPLNLTSKLSRTSILPSVPVTLTNLHKFMQTSGRSQEKYLQLMQSLERISSANLEVEVNAGVAMSLCPLLEVDVYPGEYSANTNVELTIPMGLVELFKFNVTHIPIAQLNKTKGMKSWAFCYFMSHTKPYPLHTEFLHSMSGAKSTLFQFRSDLKQYLESFKAISLNGVSFIEKFEYLKREDTFTVFRGEKPK